MEITRKAKEELENRIDRIAEFIGKKGLGSNYLQKAKNQQRDINLALAVGGVIMIAGLILWMKSKD